MSYLDALEFELAGYERAGKSDRAEQVRAEIARVKGASAERSATVADPASVPQGRSAPRKARS